MSSSRGEQKQGGVDAPTVRLASVSMDRERMQKIFSKDAPTVRLAAACTGPGGKILRTDAPTVRLAACGQAQETKTLPAPERDAGRDQFPALLVSYYYVKGFLKFREAYRYRDWVLDSGAFSAASVGAPIQLDEYIEFCKALLAVDETCVEVYALDVIRDEKASWGNYRAMWRAGIPAIPTWHYGSDEAALYRIARAFPKVALGGLVGTAPELKLRIVQAAMARIWPKPVHGFGATSEAVLFGAPLHSVDATNWEVAPCKFGRWKAYGGGNLGIRGSTHNLWPEIDRYMDLERRLRVRWKREMAHIAPQYGRYIQMIQIARRRFCREARRGKISKEMLFLARGEIE